MEHGMNCTCDVCAARRSHEQEEGSCSCNGHSHKHEHGHSHKHEHGHSHEHEHAHSHEHEHAQEEGCGCGHEHTHSAKGAPTRLIIGIILFAVSVVCSLVFSLPDWAVFVLFLAAYLVLGYNVLLAAGKNIIRGKVFDENFLMTIATIGAFVLGEYMEGAAVMLFYLIGETLSDKAVEKSRRSITELMDIRPDYANVEKDGKLVRVAPDTLRVGDVITIKPFEKVPLDSVVLEGNSSLNTSALTGESLPRDVEKGSALLAGSVNGESLLIARVEKEYGQSAAAKILDIVEHAGSKKAQTEKFITKFARYYTPIVCAAALIVAVVPSLITGDWATWVYRALLFLVISCPCALVVAVPLTYFGGIGGASKKGILVKGANHMEALVQVKEVVFDKTGTLTKGVFAVQQVLPAKGYGRDEVLELAAMAEANSSHPIAKSVVEAYGGEVDTARVAEYKDIPGHGVSAVYNGRAILAGSARLMKREGIAYEAAKEAGTALYVAAGGAYVGCILIADSLKQDAKQAIGALRQMDITTAMLTGDAKEIGEKIAAEAGIGEVYTELLPQDKVSILEEISNKQKGVAFVGDGINDAPVLARADVGIAMGALGSDAAIEAADVVLMTDEPSKVPQAIKIAGKTKRIVWQNIIFALAVKAVVMVLGVMGIADMWAAVFADVGVTLIAIVNALRALNAPK
ncbi:cadmium-translocating P-type ATPase [Christensenellaceae bacterium OttesenSCG-928-K19]|nr:cadmium-translocating P-type ATPase [Christensenellaceae bacterium OttesenSCG-928-K19]